MNDSKDPPRQRIEIPRLTLRGPFDPKTIGSEVARQVEAALADSYGQIDRSALAAALQQSLGHEAGHLRKSK
jgi:hypothetical protein